MAFVGNILLGTGSAPGLSSIASAYAESAASSRIPWGALEYSGETITAISGSAIGGQGGGDTSQCMPKSASADFILTSQSSQFITSTAGLQPSGDYAFNSALSSYLPKSASGDFAPSGDYAYNSALSAYMPKSSISSWSSDFVYKSAVSGWSSQIENLSSALSSLSSTLTSMTANKYTLSAGNGISISNDTANNVTIIAAV